MKLLTASWRLTLLLVTALLASCTGLPEAPRGKPPRLFVLLVVDGLPQWQLTAYRDQLAPDGLARLLERGAWFAEAHHGHAHTVTAAGHAALLSGAYPQRSGIIGNDWRDPASGAPVYCTSDAGARYIGHPTRPLDGTSPRNLRVETVGDMLRRADPRAKVVAVSGKDRGAILPAGQRGSAYMYQASSGQFASTTHYMARHPDWVEAFNAARPADRYFGAHWQALLPDAAYDRSLPDAQTWFAAGGRLPMPMSSADDGAPGPVFYANLLRSPFGDALTLDFARAAIAGEQLGRDAVPDILSISLSGHDYVNHAFGAESRLSHDHLLQLDRLFQRFFRDLDAQVGAGRYILLLTSDHGFQPAPESSARAGHEAGRINLGQTLGRVNAGLEQRFGAGRWVTLSASSLLIDRAQLARHPGLDIDTVADAARALLQAEPGIGPAFTRAELASGSRAGQPFFTAMQRAWHPALSGEVQFSFRPHWLPAFGAGTGTTHGSPHRYDSHVPIAIYGPGWLRPGRIDQPVDVVDIAPTVAGWLGVAPPATSQGRPLPLTAP